MKCSKNIRLRTVEAVHTYTTTLKNSKGITLIALVITIIVLLVLAGIAISMVSGNNGILNKAAEVKKSKDQTTEYEKVSLAAQSALIDGKGTINIADTTGTAKGSLKKALIEELGEDSSIVKNYKEGTVTLSNGEKYKVTISGSITSLCYWYKSGIETDISLSGQYIDSKGTRTKNLNDLYMQFDDDKNNWHFSCYFGSNNKIDITKITKICVKFSNIVLTDDTTALICLCSERAQYSARRNREVYSKKIKWK